MCLPWHSEGVSCCPCWAQTSPGSRGWWRPVRWWGWPLLRRKGWRTLTELAELHMYPGSGGLRKVNFTLMLLQVCDPKGKRSQEKKGYLCGREPAQGIPLLGEPLDHRQGGRHIPEEGVGQKAVGCHLHLCWHHCEQTVIHYQILILTLSFIWGNMYQDARAS